MSFPRYFFKCNSCDATDHGTPRYDYEIVDCPSCGKTNLTRWEAKDNMNRDWSHCVAFGHSWEPDRRNPEVEACTVCHDTRSFAKKKAV